MHAETEKEWSRLSSNSAFDVVIHCWNFDLLPVVWLNATNAICFHSNEKILLHAIGVRTARSNTRTAVRDHTNYIHRKATKTNEKCRQRELRVCVIHSEVLTITIRNLCFLVGLLFIWITHTHQKSLYLLRFVRVVHRKHRSLEVCVCVNECHKWTGLDGQVCTFAIIFHLRHSFILHHI